jgi:hypothetical protein
MGGQIWEAKIGRPKKGGQNRAAKNGRPKMGGQKWAAKIGRPIKGGQKRTKGQKGKRAKDDRLRLRLPLTFFPFFCPSPKVSPVKNTNVVTLVHASLRVILLFYRIN